MIRQLVDLNSNIITKNSELILPTDQKTPVNSGKSRKTRVVENIYSISNSDKKSYIKAKILSALKIGSENFSDITEISNFAEKAQSKFSENLNEEFSISSDVYYNLFFKYFDEYQIATEYTCNLKLDVDLIIIKNFLKLILI